LLTVLKKKEKKERKDLTGVGVCGKIKVVGGNTMKPYRPKVSYQFLNQARSFDGDTLGSVRLLGGVGAVKATGFFYGRDQGGRKRRSRKSSETG